MAKVYIIGPVGSGKTTLAKRLSKEMNIDYYELDRVVWKYHPDGDIRRSDKEIDKLFSKILKKDNWIIENVGKVYFNKGFEEADTIIYLKISRIVLYYRILKRWIKQNFGIEKTTYKPDFDMLKRMYMWANNELKNSKLNALEKYTDKIVVLNEKQINKFKYKD